MLSKFGRLCEGDERVNGKVFEEKEELGACVGWWNEMSVELAGGVSTVEVCCWYGGRRERGWRVGTNMIL